MKNYLFPALLWLLAISPAFAQKTISSALKPYAENWSYNVKRLLNHAGFDLPAAAVNKISSRSPLQLDSTKTFYGYNLNAPGDSTALFRSIYQYPQPKVKIEINYQWDNNAWLPLNRTTLTSDDQQRIVEALAEAWDPAAQAYVPDSHLESFPHGDSQELIDSFFVYQWSVDLQEWSLLLFAKNTFDAQDRLLESISSFDYLGTPLLFKDVYSYDANGDNYLIEQSAVFDGAEIPSGRVENVFADHKLIEATAFVTDGIDFYPTNRNNYAYTTFGALRLEQSFERDTANTGWDLIQRIEYGFDGEQRVASKETTFYNQDGSEERELAIYAYVEDENLAQEWLYLWNDDAFDWLLDNKKFYYYSGLVSTPAIPRPALALQIAPNPTVDAVRLTLDKEAVVQLFDASGALLQSRLVQPGQVLDLTTLPAGVYLATAQQGEDFYTGKIVKQ